MDNYVSAINAQCLTAGIPEEERFQCSILVQDHETLLLCDASPSFSALFEIDPQCRGKNISAMLREKMKFLPELLQQGKLTAKSIRYFAELEERGKPSFWDIAIELSPPFVHLLALRRTPQEIAARYCAESEVDLAGFYAPGHFSVLIRQDEHGVYRVTSRSAEAAQFCSIGSAADQEVFPRFSFLRTACLPDSGEEGKSLCFYEMTAQQSACEEKFLRVLCLPVEQGERKAFLLLGAPCPPDEFFDRYADGGRYKENGFDGCSYAVAIFSFSDGSPVPESFNRCCTELLQTGFSLPELLRSEVVLRSFRSGVPCTAQTQLGSGMYEIGVLPILRGKSVGKMMITIVPAKSETVVQPSTCTERLTPREQETLTLAAQGYPNRYIAHKLSISEGTVKKLIYNGYQKLGISSRVELCRLLSPQAMAL